MTNSIADRPFIKVEVEDRHGIYIVRVGNWRLVKDLQTGEGEWELLKNGSEKNELKTVQNHTNLLANNA